MSRMTHWLGPLASPDRRAPSGGPCGLGLPRLSHAATAPTTPSALRTITITASHPSFPARIPAGLLALHVVNDAKTVFFVGAARPNRGVSLAQAEAAGARRASCNSRASSPSSAASPCRLRPPAPSSSTCAPLAPTACTSHAAIRIPGQDLFFTVMPGRAPGRHAAARAIAVTLAGTRFVGLPQTLPAGATTFKVSGRGPGVRDMLLYRLDPGKTVHDMIVALNADARTGKDPTWAHAAGDMDVLSPHQVAWLTLTLAPGSYVALCPLPDPTRGGTALCPEGMIVPFTVS